MVSEITDQGFLRFIGLVGGILSLSPPRLSK